MPNLNQFSSDIAHSFNRALDGVLKERIKDLTIAVIAKVIKERIDKEGVSRHNLLSFKPEIIRVDVGDDCKVTGNCKIFRTENKIVKPLYYRSDAPFVNVSNVDGTVIFISTFIASQKHQRFARFTANVPMYEWRDGYLYFYNIKKMRIRVDAIYADPREIRFGCDDDNCYNEDYELPIDASMLILVRDLVIKELALLKEKPISANVELNDEKE
jgi:hypothetical protein